MSDLSNQQAALMAAATLHTGRGQDTGASGYRNKAVTDSATAFLEWLTANRTRVGLQK